MAKRSYGGGTIDERGDNTYRLRYLIDGRRYSKTFSGTKAEARVELRALLKSGDDGDHVAPAPITVGKWIDQWLEAGAPGRRRKKVSQRTLERYGQLLRTHVRPVLGSRPLQKLKASEIHQLYSAIAAAAKIAPRTQHHVHVVLGALLATAERKGLIAINPMIRVEQVPNPEGQVFEELADEVDDDIGEGLDEAGLTALVAGFRPSTRQCC
jgi:integrase